MKPATLNHLLSTTILFGLVIAGGAHATDITISPPLPHTSTVTLPSAGDTLTIEDGASLATTGTSISTAASDIIVRNFGSISSSDSSSYAIHSTGANTSFFNDGTVTTTGECAYGIFAEGDYFSLTNNGSITTLADNNSWGVYINADHARLVNNGTIETRGESGDAIVVWGANTSLTNRGTIKAKGDDAIGAYFWHTAGVNSGNILRNSGTIKAIGDGASQGVYANARGMTIINSGKISSLNAEAIVMGQADQTLALKRGSIIEGDIRFDDASTATLDVARGLDVTLRLNGTPGTINTHGRAYAIVGDVFTIVPTELTNLGAQSIASANNAISNVISGQASGRRSGSSNSGSLISSYAPAEKAAFFPDFAPKYDYSAWTSAYGAFTIPMNNDDNLRSSQGGVLFGLDKKLEDGTVIGIVTGAGYGAIRQDNGSKIDNSSVLIGVYSSFDVDRFFVEANASVGAVFSDSSRKIANSMVSGGIEHANSQYHSLYVAPSVKIGTQHDLGSILIKPSINLGYTGIYQESYDEGNASTSLSFGSSYTNIYTAAGELELSSIRQENSTNPWHSSVKFGLEGTLIDNGDMNVAILGSSQIVSGASETQARSYLGAELTYTEGRLDFTTKGDIGYSTKGDLSFNIQSGIRMKF